MSRTLPVRPDFTQLKIQAKDLLNGHRRKDVAVCDILRLLRRFATMGDAGILSEPLALHEAQYALAMDYGFASWNALKRYVEQVTGRPSPVHREKSRTYITGLEKHSVGAKDAHDNSFIASIAGVMQALGEEFTYPYLMGVSGAAFRILMAEPNWCPSAACAPCGYNCIPGAMSATGYRLKWIETQKDNKWLDDGIKEALQAVSDNVDRGVPIIAAGKESSLIVGYHADGKLLGRRYELPEEGYQDIEVFDLSGQPKWAFGDGKWNDWVWSVGIVEPADVPIDRCQAVVDSLHLAVKLARTERFDQYFSSFAAYEYWIEGLLDDSRYEGLTEDNWFGTAHANGYCYPCLWSARYNAEKYLREIADDFKPTIKSRLLAIAGLYQRIHETLSRTKPEFECIWSLMPWMLKSPNNWTRAIREKEANLLREALTIEREAISKIEDVLSII